MNDIQLRWATRTEERFHERDECPSWEVKTKVLQYRKYYNRSVYAANNWGLPLTCKIEDWGWSEWMDVPDE